MKSIFLALLMSFSLCTAYASGDDIKISVCSSRNDQTDLIVKNEKSTLRHHYTEDGRLVTRRLDEDVIRSGHLEGKFRDEIYEYMALTHSVRASLMYEVAVGDKKTKKSSSSYIIIDGTSGIYLLMKDVDGISVMGCRRDCDAEEEKVDPIYVTPRTRKC